MEKKDHTKKNASKTNDHTHNTQSDNPYHISYENYLDTNACTECTGLMPNGADGRGEWDSYREIFDFIPLPSKEETDGR